MTGDLLRAAKWTTALLGLLLSPFFLGALIFVAYFLVDGARTAGPSAVSAGLCLLFSATLLLRRRKTHPEA